jgi:MFS family permease
MTPRERRLSLVAILASAACVGLVIGMTAPLMALFLERRGYSEGFIGINAAIASAALLAMGPFVPRIGARFGIGPAVLGGSALGALLLAVLPFSEGVLALSLLRIGLGAANAVDWVLSETWINLLAGERARGRVLSIYAAIWGGGMAAGPLLLGLVGSEGEAPFLLAAAILVISMLPVAASRRIAPPMPPGSGRGNITTVVRLAPLPIAAGFLCGYGEGTVLSLFPVFGLDQGFSERRVVGLASAFATGALLLQPVCGLIVDALSSRTAILLFLAIGLGLTVAVRLVVHDDVLIWPAVALWGASLGGFYTIGLTTTMRSVAAGLVAAANTTFIMAYMSGFVAGPLAGGLAMEQAGASALIAAVAVPFLILLPFAILRR